MLLRNMSPSVVSKVLSLRPSLLACTVLFSGCAYGEMTQVLRAEVASETDCSSVVVKKASAYAPGYEPGMYLVKGCNIDRIYSCKDSEGLVKFGDPDCTFKSPTAARAPAAPPPPAADEPESLDEEPSNG